jgi:hypothetical protein
MRLAPVTSDNDTTAAAFVHQLCWLTGSALFRDAMAVDPFECPYINDQFIICQRGKWIAGEAIGKIGGRPKQRERDSDREQLSGTSK